MDFFKAQFTEIPAIPAVDLSKATVLITGANGGIGFETAREMLKSKPKKLILAVRNIERGNAAREELSVTASTEIIVKELDQASFNSVKQLVESLADEKVDIAILNAGVWKMQWSHTADGYEETLQTNVLGPALLSLLLLPKLRLASTSKSASLGASISRLCFVASGLHARARFPERSLPTGQILSTLNDQSKYADNFDGTERYSTSKLLNLLWTRALANRTPSTDVIINAANPGFCNTSLQREASGIRKYAGKVVGPLLGRSPQAGARCVVEAVIAKGDDSHGRYLSEAQIADEVDYVRGRNGDELQKKIWDEIITLLEKESAISEVALNGDRPA